MQVEKKIGSCSLMEAVDRILDKSIVINAWVGITLVGIEFLAIEAKMVRAGVETFLKYDKAIDLASAIPTEQGNPNDGYKRFFVKAAFTC